MNTNRITIIGSIIAIILIISIPTCYKVIKSHNDNLLEVVEDKIIASAKKCYFEEKCKNDKITLQELYELQFLEKVNNPITKEYYNDNSYVMIDNGNFIFKVIE